MWNAVERETPWDEVVALYPSAHNEYLTKARTALSSIEKSGTHKVVPVEPDDPMIAAGGSVREPDGGAIYYSVVEQVWQAMLSASPSVL